MEKSPRVALFVTCLVDLFRPSVAFSAIKLLQDAGCEIDVPDAQTCCGQPAFNSGDRKSTADIARQVIEAFDGYDYVVVPSGSCAGMIKKHYAELFEAEPDWRDRAEALSAKTFELVSFLVDVLDIALPDVTHRARATYHDSCSGLRELGIQAQPRKLLSGVDGLDLREMDGSDICCGFGGTFCVKYGEISNAIVEKKTASIEATGADLLLAGDLGCLMNMAGKLKRQGSSVQARHIAEILAGDVSSPAIGEDG